MFDLIHLTGIVDYGASGGRSVRGDERCHVRAGAAPPSGSGGAGSRNARRNGPRNHLRSRKLEPDDGLRPIRGVQFIQTKDEQRELPRPPKKTGELYRLVVSQVALLCLRDVFDADPAIQAVAFNGHVWATNPATVGGSTPA